MNVIKLYAGILALLAILSLVQCRKERFMQDTSARLEFSSDTILFDTVFATIGSTTQYLRVRNPYNETIRIDEIALIESSAPQFRINVDGLDGPVQEGIDILPNDSIYIFVEVTVDPLQPLTDNPLPFILEGSIRFRFNGNEQSVSLQAWGQNAHFHGGLNSCDDPFSYIIPSGTTEIWANDLPHVIYGIIAVDSGATLHIDPGTQVYCHGKSGIYVYKGQLEIAGNLGAEVVFQGDRLESYYDDVPGQWGIQLDCPYTTAMGPQIASIVRGGIWIYQSPYSKIQYAVFRNGNIGIQVDTTGVSYTGVEYSVEIENTKILNMAGIGLLGQGASISGKNMLVANCGQQSAYLGLGGRYSMENCTFANYGADNSRQTPTFVLNNYYEDIYQNIQVREIYQSRFNNCIMFGNNAFLSDFNEFLIDLEETGPADYQFRYCLVDTDESVEDDGNHFESMINNQAPFFCNTEELNFRISANSDIMKGILTPTGEQFDIEGNFWGGQVWKGCYTFDESSPCE